jgi:hypothetical protein
MNWNGRLPAEGGIRHRPDRAEQQPLPLRADLPDLVERLRLQADVNDAAVELQLAEPGRSSPRVSLAECRALLHRAERAGIKPIRLIVDRTVREVLRAGNRTG